MSKPRSLTRFDKLDDWVKQQIKTRYPYGFDKYLVSFKDAGGKFVLALPFETESIYYLIKMTRSEAIRIFMDAQREEDEYPDVVDITEGEDDGLDIEEIPEGMLNEEVEED